MMAICTICGKSKTVGSNVSKSQRHTKRFFRPNLQKVNGAVLCTRCSRTAVKEDK
ncbi:MAG: bL28 family ribosomal protein [Candidatus Berkelbacteria bacterium]|nr:bL28 family ribosomal protein [Candidatus Berkelbacteria bacterium]